ncbi:hypothetical protein J2045_001657 [Peteryoungia aggregata LMG 23059]|uniref:Uncharacterized protein n=1 Tax=Peteryoungia aggregata LMG 23059 TaxID=1368425 RepID=A0ABU0G5K6_9HYPH|nr:hypothetical protein [Peteryoungia aggregata]MDQ0420633.1 hypothetical protein [Peteryoungia aggregata LMG 23059]
MLKSRLALTALSVLLIGTSGVAQAGDHDQWNHRGQSHAIIGSNGLPSVIPGIGTFAGNVSALRIKGNGVFFAIDRTPGPKVVAYRAPKAKIIEISAENPEEACSFEAGVCIIRPKN